MSLFLLLPLHNIFFHLLPSPAPYHDIITTCSDYTKCPSPFLPSSTCLPFKACAKEMSHLIILIGTKTKDVVFAQYFTESLYPFIAVELDHSLVFCLFHTQLAKYFLHSIRQRNICMTSQGSWKHPAWPKWLLASPYNVPTYNFLVVCWKDMWTYTYI